MSGSETNINDYTNQSKHTTRHKQTNQDESHWYDDLNHWWSSERVLSSPVKLK